MNIKMVLAPLFITVALYGGTMEGYLNVTVPPGVSLVGMPFKASDNLASNVFPRVPVGTEIYKWEGDHFVTNSLLEPGWIIPDQKILPGEAAFLFNPGDQTENVALVGQILPLPTTNAI